MPSDAERLAVVEYAVKEVRDEVRSISRNMWAVVLAVAGMLGKFVLDRFGVDEPAAAPTAALGFAFGIVQALWGLLGG